MSEINLAESTICVVGLRRRENELMVSYLEGVTKANCVAGDNDYDIPENLGSPKLILWCCQDAGTHCLSKFKLKNNGEDYKVLINVPSDRGIEEEALNHGVLGFFYDSDPLNHLPKGLQAVLSGEFWVPRQILTKYILQLRSSKPKSGIKAAESLSGREREILNLITGGETNEGIAERLNISPHTVKTHLYNTFRKINVPNRLQAILWAGQNL